MFFLCLFGREACINFIELCKQKNDDRLWMDELAAMQACPQPVMPYLENSGIILAGEDTDPAHGMVININRNGKPNGGLDNSVSDSTTSHGSLEANQGKGLISVNYYLLWSILFFSNMGLTLCHSEKKKNKKKS